MKIQKTHLRKRADGKLTEVDTTMVENSPGIRTSRESGVFNPVTDQINVWVEGMGTIYGVGNHSAAYEIERFIRRAYDMGVYNAKRDIRRALGVEG